MTDITALVQSTLQQLSETLQNQQQQALHSMQQQLTNTLQTLKTEQKIALATLQEQAKSDNKQLEILFSKLTQLQTEFEKLK